MDLHCWKDEGEDLEERFGFHSPEHLRIYEGPGGTCLLSAGHEGPHEFTPDTDVGVSFSALG